jgi:hypothetical protein
MYKKKYLQRDLAIILVGLSFVGFVVSIIVAIVTG